MPFYRRRLPHLYVLDQPLFITWRLHGSLPGNRRFPDGPISSGRAFVTMDRLLDAARSGPRFLSDPRIANMVVAALDYNASVLKRCHLHTFAVMPNHVHLLASLQVPLPEFMRSLKTFTAKRANQILGLTGQPFWQEESYDRLVRDSSSFERIRRYIEENPVNAGLVKRAADYRWSSAAEFKQYRLCVGGGPSLNKWPR